MNTEINTETGEITLILSWGEAYRIQSALRSYKGMYSELEKLVHENDIKRQKDSILEADLIADKIEEALWELYTKEAEEDAQAHACWTHVMYVDE